MRHHIARATCAALAPLLLITSALAQPRGPQKPDAIVPFKIQVSDAVLSDLKQRLSRTRLPQAIPGTGWDYGMDAAFLKEMVEYWRTRFDWRAQEKKLNVFDHFKTSIDGLDIHFIHQRAKTPTDMAVLLLNGWPSSFVEYAKVIGPLAEPVAHGGRAEDAVNVVVPSLPGFGFSGAPQERGYNPARIARAMATLMARLGYTKYVAHGSDWGFGIGTHLAVQDAAHMAGLHLVTCSGLPATGALGATPAAATAGSAERMAYAEIHSTKPQTLGASLSDSPAGLAAWILEKWYAWSDHDGDVGKVYTKDELLTNVMIYWVTNTGASSTRLYYEARHPDGRLTAALFPGLLPESKVSVPTGCALFDSQYDSRGNRMGPPSAANIAARRASAETRYPIVHFAIMPSGGHFPAAEQPVAWIEDLRTFLRARR